MDTNKLKWVLRTITVCCAILPLLFTVVVYRENLFGLLVPPQITDAMSGKDQAVQKLIPDLHNMAIVNPTFNDDFHFNTEDGTYSVSINLISPLETSLTFNSLSVTVTDENSTFYGTIHLTNPVTLAPSNNTAISLEGTLSQDFVALLQSSGIDLTDPNFNPQNLSERDIDLSTIHLTNVNIDVGGVQVHIDELNSTELFGIQDTGLIDGV